jgi:pyruvate/2-oxoglutarate dehydrogenase complex dihydrolipoamide acyltransferase (E2) component
MVRKLLMPRVDPNVDEGTVASWLVEPGSAVEAGQPVVEIITDKATFELEVEAGGILRRHCASPRSVVPVGYVLALLSDDAGEPLPDVTEENGAILAAYREALLGAGDPGTDASFEDVEGAGPRKGPRATPSARRLAAREGIDLAVLGRRRQGVIRLQDVEEAMRRRQGGAQA